MRRLIWGFAGRTYHIVGNLMSRLIYSLWTAYSHTTTILAIYLVISCQKYRIGSLLLSSRCITNYMKTCSFLHAHFSEARKVVENFVNNTYGGHLIWYRDKCWRYTLELPLWGNFNEYHQYNFYVTENKEKCIEIYPYWVSWYLLSLPLLNISNCQSFIQIPVMHLSVFSLRGRAAGIHKSQPLEIR